jgi:outer membrane protein assembly factor BamB
MEKMRNILICVFLLLIVVNSCIGQSRNISDNTININSTLQIFDWPMYNHDTANSGFSNSSLPDVLNISWKTDFLEDLDFKINCSSSPIISNGMVLILGLTKDNGFGSVASIVALNESNGSLIWKKDFDVFALRNPSVYGSPAVQDGKVFFCISHKNFIGCKSKVYALNLTNGNMIWNKTISGFSIYPSVAVSDGNVFVVSHLKIPISKLYAFNEKNGDLLWRKNVFGYCEITPVVDEHRVVIVSNQLRCDMYRLIFHPLITIKSKIYAFNKNDGSMLWKKNLKGSVALSSPTLSSGKLFIPATKIGISLWNCKIYALDISSGCEKWYFSINLKAPVTFPASISTPSVSYGKVFATIANCKIFAVDQETGKTVWIKDIVNDSNTIKKLNYPCVPPVVADEKVITLANLFYDGSENRKICMFNVSDGSLVWDYDLDEFIDHNIDAPITIANQKLFVNAGHSILSFG